MYSHIKGIYLHSIRDILPQNTVLSSFKSVISSVLTPSGVLRNVWFIFSFWRVFEDAYFTARVTGFSFRQAQTMHGPAEYFVRKWLFCDFT